MYKKAILISAWMLLFSIGIAQAEPGARVSGTVTDAKGIPLIGVTVAVPKTSIGTILNFP